MVLHTASGYPYVQPADTVTSFPTTSQELATVLETSKPKAYARIAYTLGSATGNVVLKGGSAILSANITYDPATGRITCPTAGLYLIVVRTGINGAVTCQPVVYDRNGVIAAEGVLSGTSTWTRSTVALMMQFAAGDWVTCNVSMGATATLTIGNTDIAFVSAL